MASTAWRGTPVCLCYGARTGDVTSGRSPRAKEVQPQLVNTPADATSSDDVAAALKAARGSK